MRLSAPVTLNLLFVQTKTKDFDFNVPFPWQVFRFPDAFRQTKELPPNPHHPPPLQALVNKHQNVTSSKTFSELPGRLTHPIKGEKKRKKHKTNPLSTFPSQEGLRAYQLSYWAPAVSGKAMLA